MGWNDHIDRKSPHPDFKYCCEGAAPVVFVFERAQYALPTTEQVADYNRRRKIVEENGGRMISMLHEVAGKNPRFTAEECAEMIASVARTYPDLEVLTHWNGEGCYTFSVGCKVKE